MAISWNPSRGPTLGVEWEVQLVDAQSRLLRQDAKEVLAGLPGLDANGEHPNIRHELMQSTVEVVTGICSTVSEASTTSRRQSRNSSAARKITVSFWLAPERIP